MLKQAARILKEEQLKLPAVIQVEPVQVQPDLFKQSARLLK